MSSVAEFGRERSDPSPAAVQADGRRRWAGERACPPDETLARLSPHCAALGITRIGLVTGLDVTGIPVGFAVRPNGFALSVHQGKGLDDGAAMVSAAMEAAEVALSETAGDRAVVLAPAELAGSVTPLPDLARLTRCDPGKLDVDRPIAMLEGRDLVSGRGRMVPLDLVAVDHRHIAPDDAFDRSSDGLASGNTPEEAILHGLLELVERDAVACLRVRGRGALAARRFPSLDLADRVLADIEGRLAASGLALALLDATSDIGLPVVAAMIGPADAPRRPDLTPAAFCGGFACHPDAAVAAVRATLEAVQARTTAIAGARDDIGAAWYGLAAHGDPTVASLAAVLAAPATAEAPRSVPQPTTPGGRTDDLLARLGAAGMAEVVAVEIPAPAGIHVRRMIVPGLEIGPGAPGRRIGRRLLAALLGRR